MHIIRTELINLMFHNLSIMLKLEGGQFYTFAN